MTDPQVRNQTVLVTGGAGFIGSHLVESLVADNTVRVLDDFSTGRRSWVDDRAEIITGDIRDRSTVASAIEGVETVFHHAANVSVDRSIEDPVGSHETNVRGTLNILECARETDARVVFASSAAVYGEPATVPIPEDAPKDPRSPYGIGKLTADHYVRRYHDLYGLETVALRYFNVYGPCQHNGDYSGVISVFLEQATAGEPLTIHGDGTQTRDFVHVEDVVQANHRAAIEATPGMAYNIGCGEAISIRELAELIGQFADGTMSIIETEPRTGDIDESEPVIDRAKRDLGYTPTVAIAQGLRRLSGTRNN